MKRLFFTALIILALTETHAQTNTNTFPPDGSVGIGTLSPAYKLDVNGTGNFSNTLTVSGGTIKSTYYTGLTYPYNTSFGNGADASFTQLYAGSTNGYTTGLYVYGGGATYRPNTITLNTGSLERLTILNNGNIGIGTINPGNTLDVNGGITTNSSSNINGITINTSNVYYKQLCATGYNLVLLSGDGSAQLTLPYNNNSYPRFQNYGLVVDGNVGIGTISPDAKLAVNGTIHTKEVKVDLTGWPDYVFRPSYKIRSLAQVESYIDKYHHLPDIPSEKQVAENGVNLGEAVKLQMKKIEELTRYLIEMKKDNERLNARLKALEKKGGLK